MCCPYGTRAFVPLHPALPCRAFISRRYAAGVLVVLAELAFNGASHAHAESGLRQFTSRRKRSSRARVAMVRIFSAAGVGAFGSAVAISRERCNTVGG